MHQRRVDAIVGGGIDTQQALSQGVGLVRSGWWSRQWDGWDELGLGARRALARRAMNKLLERSKKGCIKRGNLHQQNVLLWHGSWVGGVAEAGARLLAYLPRN